MVRRKMAIINTGHSCPNCLCLIICSHQSKNWWTYHSTHPALKAGHQGLPCWWRLTVLTFLNLSASLDVADELLFFLLFQTPSLFGFQDTNGFFSFNLLSGKAFSAPLLLAPHLLDLWVPKYPRIWFSSICSNSLRNPIGSGTFCITNDSPNVPP